MNQIGIMQGRLSPSVPGRPQVFPWSSWEEEFPRARACGFEVIEWLFEANRYAENPIWTASGREKIRRLIAATGIEVCSVCADYFMAHPFFRTSGEGRARSVEVLETLIANAASLGIRTIVLPVLEECEVRTRSEKVELLDALRRPLDVAARHGVRLALETELPAGDYRALVEEGDHLALGICYDCGNATARGYDIAADVRTLGPWLSGIHVKDRKRGGGSVPLGRGDVDFTAFFRALEDVRYEGPVIVQAAWGDDYLGLARTYAGFVRDRLLLRAVPER